MKNIILIFAVILLMPFSCKNVQKISDDANIEIKSFDISIYQNGNIENRLNNFSIRDDYFDIVLNGINNETIQVFVYHNNEMFEKYNYPIRCDQTVIFHPATSLINNADEEKKITLYINKEMQFNVINENKWIKNGNDTIIRIKDIADTNNKFTGNLFVSIFVDFNKNNIIDANEIKNIVIRINKNNNSTLFRAKVYVSTMGTWLYDIDYKIFGKNYFYVKITNTNERERFFKLFGQNFDGHYDLYFTNIRNLDYRKYNLYILFSPKTTDIELYNNPYHYNGENRLIFDINVNKESKRGEYVFYRKYQVEKRYDEYEMWINDNGNHLRVSQLEL